MDRLRAHDPDLRATKNALRAAIVAPAVLALGEIVIGNSVLALFAVFPALGLFVFVEFGGPIRSRALAYLGLWAAGLVLITLGTLSSEHTWIATGAMAVIGFIVLFAGVVNGYIAAAGTSALLAFILSVMVPAGASEIPSRLGGWGLGAGSAALAVMLLWPSEPRDRLRSSLAAACRTIAEAISPREGRSDEDRSQAVADAAIDVRETYVSTPYRPTGASGASATLTYLVGDISWLRQYATAPVAAPTFPSEGAAIRDAGAEVLRAAAARLEGSSDEPVPLEPLERARERCANVFARIVDPAHVRDEVSLEATFNEAYTLRGIAYGVRQIGVRALVAAGEPNPEPELVATLPGPPAGVTLRSALAGARQLAGGYVDPRSVCLRNSLRGAVGLSLAVLIGHLSDLQHGFWIVLGTMSVLRSSALGTGATILRALGGTVVGITVGGVTISLVGSDTNVLWAIFPFSVLLTAFAPRAISFLAGQAAFTAAVLILFDIIAPRGWQVGLVRIEDIAIGCGVSLVAGLLFWPRGAAAVVRDSAAAAYRTSIEYLSRAASALLDSEGEGYRQDEALDRAGAESLAANFRLDDAFRVYLAERSSAHVHLRPLGALVSGALRVRRMGYLLQNGQPLWRLGPLDERSPELIEQRRELDRELDATRAWFTELGQALVEGRTPAPAPAAVGAGGALRFARAAAAAGHDQDAERALAIAWTHEHLQALHTLQPRLEQAAAELAPERSG